MNHLITDNKIGTLTAYVKDNLMGRYDQREASNIAFALFDDLFGWTRSQLIERADQSLSESEILKIHFSLRSLNNGIPLQYITGKSHFYGHVFHVTPDVLIPRPETEELVHLIVKTHPNAHSVLDIGTGSGCIAISLSKAIKGAAVSACDISEKALIIAEENAQHHPTEIHFFLCNILTEEPEGGPWEIIVSNPPYIPHSEMAEMDDLVIKNEPHLALFVEDHDPLIFYKRIMDIAQHKLTPPGKIYFEIHELMLPTLSSYIEEKAVWNHQFHTDLQGKNRILVLTRLEK